MNVLKKISKNISYTVTSNLVSLIVSAVVTLFLPKFLGINEYGYYQLYLFYVSYIGFLHFGWCDGVYLRYGGKQYEGINKSIFKGQFLMLFFLELCITFIFLMYLYFNKNMEANKLSVLCAVSSNIIILNLRNFILLLLQATNRLKEYSFITILDRLLFLLIVQCLLIIKVKKFQYIILADVFSRFFSLLVSVIKVKEITLLNPVTTQFSLIETIKNIKVGINLMFANIASMLIIGIVRFAIQWKWSVDTFGKISLTLSISNLLMVFINAISLAIFPLLKQVDKCKYRETYPLIRACLMPTVLVLLFFYYPISSLLNIWLPQYKTSLKFMAIVFPIVVFDSKVSLLTNTFFKAMRKEKIIFKINLCTAFISFFTTFFTVSILENIELTILNIVLLLSFRSTISEIILGKILNMYVYKDILLEYFLVILFIISGWYFYGWVGMFMYILGLITYLISKKQEFKNLYKLVTKLD